MPTDESPEFIGWTEPVTLPDDVVRVTSSTAAIVLGPSGDGRIDFGLYVDLPLPIGPLRITLAPEQLAGIHDRLHSLLALNADQVQTLTNQIHDHA